MPDPTSAPRPWEAAYPPGVPLQYRYPSVPVTRFLADAARDFPRATALRTPGATWRYDELVGVVDRVAALLREHGLGPGGGAAVVARSPLLHAVAALAAWRVGGVVVPLDPAEDALATRLGAAAPTLVVCDAASLDLVLGLRTGLTTVRAIVVGDPAAWGGAVARLRTGLLRRAGRRRAPQPGDDVVDLDEAVAGGPALVGHAATAASSPALLTWSSATGSPEGHAVTLTHAQLVAAAFQLRLWIPDVRAGREVLCSGLPPWHASGVVGGLLAPLLVAGSVVQHDEAVPTGAQLTGLVGDAEASLLLATVPQMTAALRAGGRRAEGLGSVRVGLTLGTALPTATRLRFEEATGGRLREGYGTAETGALTHATPVYGRLEPGTVGLPVTDTAAIVRRLDGTGPAATGEVGELLVAGPQVAVGAPVTVAEQDEAPVPPAPVEAVPPHRARRWLATGDLASMDVRGTFELHGRREELVERDEGTVVPGDLERALLEHPGVDRAAVLGVPVGDTVQLHAVVVPQRTARLRRDELRAHLGALVAPGLQPDDVHLRDRLPTGPLGAVRVRELRDELRPLGVAT